MLKYLALWAALAAAAGADDEGMVPIGDAFYIDIYEYPNRPGILPKVNATWREAETLCAAQGKRLCTEQEWQKACTGSQNYIYSAAWLAAERQQRKPTRSRRYSGPR